MDNKAGGLLQKYNRHVPGAILPKGHAEQNGSLMVGHHTLAAWFRGMLTDRRAMTAEAITSFHHFSLWANTPCSVSVCYVAGRGPMPELSELAHKVEFYELCFHVMYF